MICCFGGSEFEHLEEPSEIAEPNPLSTQLLSDIGHLQYETKLPAVWESVVLTPEDTTEITDPYVIACLQEAYFALQARRTVIEFQVRFLRRYMQYLTQCPLDKRFDPAVARVIFGEHYAFFCNVCRAYGTWTD
jgi:hypothetical protein